MEFQELKNIVENTLKKLEESGEEAEYQRLLKETSLPSFWENQEEASKKSKRFSFLQRKRDPWVLLARDIESFQEVFIVLSEEERIFELQQLEKRVHEAKLSFFLSGEYDSFPVIMTFSVGAGGDDAFSWTEMLFTMYLKYAEKKGYKTTVIDIQYDTVGIRSASVKISGGNFLYGYLKGENGTHRLVRKSPFNSGNTRETSFASVEVVPDIPKNETTLSFADSELRIDTFRAQGAGGQHVNTTDSAVRITHIPTGIVVQCQNQRSQHQNKEQALSVLYSRVADYMRKQEEEKTESFKQGKVHTSFGGGHIRSYVLDDQYIKDTRTGYKTSQVEAVLSGDIDNFLEAFIVL
jgi:peptide chain release factor 2